LRGAKELQGKGRGRGEDGKKDILISFREKNIEKFIYLLPLEKTMQKKNRR